MIYYALVVILHLPLSRGFLPVHPLDVSRKNFHHFPFAHPMDLIMMINAFTFLSMEEFSEVLTSKLAEVVSR